MKNNRRVYIGFGILFLLAALMFAAGTVNHIVNTGEGVISSVLLMLGCICAGVAFLKKK